MNDGCRLGIDSFADTCVAGKHAHVIDFIEGKEISAKAWDGHQTRNLRIANVAYAYDSPSGDYAYDSPSGDTIILVFNQSIYGGEFMNDSLLNPIQCIQNDVKVDIRPRRYYPNEIDPQTIQFQGRVINLEYDGPLPFINIRRPTKEEFKVCAHFDMTSIDDWDPYNSSTSFVSMVVDAFPGTSEEDEFQIMQDYCSITSFLLPGTIFSALDDFREIKSFYTEGSDEPEYRSTYALGSNATNTLTPEDLSKLWGIGIKTARRTLKATTHRCIRTVGDLTRRFRTDKAHMRFRRLTTKQGQFYVDTLKSKVKSIRGFTCGNLYTNNLGFRKFFPMSTESDTPPTLQAFITLVGLPHAMHSDNAKVFVEGDFSRKCTKFDIKQTFTEPHSPWQDRAETGIREIKAYGRRTMAETQAPIRLWCFAYEYAADICCLLATGLYDLGGRTPYEHVMQHTPDISEYTVFKWYQWAYYWDELEKEKKLCRWLGTASNVGQSMCFWVLLPNEEFIARSTVIPIPDMDLNDAILKERMNQFTLKLHDSIGDHTTAVVKEETVNDDKIYYDAFFDTTQDDDITWPWEKELDELPLADETEATLEALDIYIGTQVVLPGTDGETVLAKVAGRKRDHNGLLVGTDNQNPILDTRVYQVEFPDGHLEEYSTNMIAEALYSQVDEEGFDTGILQEICDHQMTNSAVPISEGFSGEGKQKKPVVTTKGWKLKVLWKDGSYDWLPLSQVKAANPIETAEYAVAQGIHKEPAFNWWLPHVLRKRDSIIHKCVTRMRKSNKMKFGIMIPDSIQDAYKLEDAENGNTYWQDSIKLEMDSIMKYKTFRVLDDDERMPVGFQEIKCHLIFDVKFDLQRKSRYVAGGHLVRDQPSYNTYSSVVSRESVRIGFLVAALNDLDVWAGDISNAYLHAETKEKVWFRAGAEFGNQVNRRVIIVRALYGLPGSGNAWRAALAGTLRNHMGYTSTLADPDVWYKAETKCNGEEYYSYILVYVDDVLCIHEHPEKIMNMIQGRYPVKPKSIGPPSVYLGANIQKLDSKTPGKQCYGQSCEQYVREAVNLDNPVNYLDSPEARAKVMKEFYPDAEEKIPPNAPKSRGKPVQINCFVDSDHAGNLATRRSHTGILIFLNMAPISWYSKRQNTVESSTFSSEFIALKTAVEQLMALRYKLRMFGIPIEGPARAFCDNEAVYKNSSDPASTLRRRHQSIAYHTCREAVASGLVLIYKEDGDTNLSDILTKSTLSRDRRKFLRERIMVYGKVKSLKKS